MENIYKKCEEVVKKALKEYGYEIQKVLFVKEEGKSYLFLDPNDLNFILDKEIEKSILKLENEIIPKMKQQELGMTYADIDRVVVWNQCIREIQKNFLKIKDGKSTNL